MEFAASQLHTTGPLLLLSSVSPIVAAFRLAQSLMGPVNLVFSAVNSNLLAQMATSQTSDSALIRTGKRSARNVTLLATVTVLAALVAVLLVPNFFKAVSTPSLVLGIVCIGAWTITSAATGIHTVLMRALLLQRLITQIRFLNVLSTWVAFAAGYVIGGATGSLVIGFGLSAVTNPVVTFCAARPKYRERMAREVHAPGSD